MFAQLLHNQLPNLEEWLIRAAQRDPLKAADLMLRISERFTPALSRTEITGPDGEAFTPITINLPNIPKIHLGEATASSLLTSPAEEVKELREGAPTMIPMFLPELSDSQPIREGAPTEDPDGHYGHRQSVVSEIPEHYGHSQSAVSGEDSKNSSVGASSQDHPGDGDGGNS